MLKVKKLAFTGLQDLELKRVIMLDQNFFPFPWDKQQWEEIQGRAGYVLYGLYKEFVIEGFALFLVSDYDKESHLLKITINKSLRNIGLASRLLEESLVDLASEVNSCYLEVSTLNEAAIKLYQKYDFQILVEKKKFYSNGENAFAMQRSFN